MTIEEAINLVERLMVAVERNNELLEAKLQQVDEEETGETINAPKADRRKQATQLLEAKDGSGQTNVYQILFDKYGFKMFDVRKAHVEAFRRCSQQRLFLELKLLEEAKAARPMDDLRLQWILERVLTNN